MALTPYGADFEQVRRSRVIEKVAQFLAASNLPQLQVRLTSAQLGPRPPTINLVPNSVC